MVVVLFLLLVQPPHSTLSTATPTQHGQDIVSTQRGLNPSHSAFNGETTEWISIAETLRKAMKRPRGVLILEEGGPTTRLCWGDPHDKTSSKWAIILDLMSLPGCSTRVNLSPWVFPKREADPLASRLQGANKCFVHKN